MLAFTEEFLVIIKADVYSQHQSQSSQLHAISNANIPLLVSTLIFPMV